MDLLLKLALYIKVLSPGSQSAEFGLKFRKVEGAKQSQTYKFGK
jgi:hypothetical protein